MPPDGPICIAPTKQQFAAKVLELIGAPVVLGCKGDFMVDHAGQVRRPLDRVYVDCSGSVTWPFWLLSGINLRSDFGAQKLHDACPELLDGGQQEPGDLGFMGFDDRHVGHVVVALAGGRCFSADGADANRWTFDELIRVLADERCRGRIYEHVPQVWGAEHFLGYRRNVLFDADFLKKHATPSKEL